MFFSPGKKIAHIWCVLSDVPLCVAYREDFPKLWRDLQVGSRVQLRALPFGELMRVVEMKFFARERAEGA